MKTVKVVGLVALLTAVAVGAVVRWRAQEAPPPPGASSITETSSESRVVVAVTVTPLREGEATETLQAYGPVEAATAKTETFTLLFECRVLHVLVSAGQAVAQGDPLLEVEPSPDARLALAQARAERDAARDEAALLERRLEMKLVTRPDLLQAQRAQQDAELRVQSLVGRGIDVERRIVRASVPGLISQLSVQQGQLVSAGGTLVETIGDDQIEVRLGVELTAVDRLQPNQEVQLRPVNAPAARTIKGNIRLITHRVNRETRLVDVFVTPAPGTHLLLAEYVEGRITVASGKALLVPRAAVIADEDHFVLFTVEDGKAVKRRIELGVEDGAQVQVIGADLHVGQSVVVQGASELQDGVAVEPRPAS